MRDWHGNGADVNAIFNTALDLGALDLGRYAEIRLEDQEGLCGEILPERVIKADNLW